MDCLISPPSTSLTYYEPATQLQMQMFDGARADLTKSMSINPLFQVTHSFALGSQTLPSSYNFGAMFANTRVRQVCAQALCCYNPKYPQVFLQGSVDHDGNVNARFNHGWSEKHVSKFQAQVSSVFTLILHILKDHWVLLVLAAGWAKSVPDGTRLSRLGF